MLYNIKNQKYKINQIPLEERIKNSKDRTKKKNTIGKKYRRLYFIVHFAVQPPVVNNFTEMF